MRIIRNNDSHDHNDDGGDDRDRRLDELAAGVPTGEVGNVLADEASAFLAAAVAAADRREQQNVRPEPVESDAVQQKPALRLVTTDTDTTDDQATVSGAVGPVGRWQIVRATAAGSSLVVAAAALTAWGEPATVVVPVAGYAAGWLAYLWWNAALRPPLPTVLGAIAATIARTGAGSARMVLAAAHWLLTRATAARHRHENTRTATNPTAADGPRPADVA